MQTLISMGAIAAESPKAVAENSDIIFSIVGYPGMFWQSVSSSPNSVLQRMFAKCILAAMAFLLAQDPEA